MIHSLYRTTCLAGTLVLTSLGHALAQSASAQAAPPAQIEPTQAKPAPIASAQVRAAQAEPLLTADERIAKALARKPQGMSCKPINKGKRMHTNVNGHSPGIYIASANLPRVANDWRTYACAKPDVRTLGANVIVPWSKIDSGRKTADGTPLLDWSYLDEAIAPWARNAQKVNILLWASAQRTFQHIDGEPATPRYVLDQVPTVRCYRERREDRDRGWTNLSADSPDAERRRDPNDVDVPLHWDETYQSLYRPVIEQFIRRYEGEPYVNYLRVGIGVGAESYPANGVPNSFGGCRDEWEAAGLTPQRWTDHVLGMVDYIGSLKPQSPFVITLNTLDGAPTLPRQVAKLAVETYGMGIGSQGGTARAIEQYRDPDKQCYAEWCSLFELYRDAGVPLELQTPRQSDPMGISGGGGAGSTGLVGPLPEFLEFAMDRGATTFELYPFEWFVATGNLPRWREQRKDYNRALKRAAKRLSEVD